MNEVASYLAAIELAFVSSPIIAEYQIVRTWANTDDGYIRLRAMLTNGDFIEATEYFVLHAGQIVTEDYRHQWMDGNRTVLRKRWDSTPHHPTLDNFPHHVHVGSEETVIAGQPLNLIDLLKLIEDALV